MPMEVTIASAFHIILLTLLLFKLMILGVAQTVSEIRLGSSITAGGSTMFWASPSGEFAFGFKRVVDDDANINNGTRPFLLAIWFNRIPEQTTVWYAKTRANPVPIQSKVELTNDGNLVLSDPQGRELWKAQSTINGTNIINSASMGDDGNFVLKYKPSGIKAWESFKDPTDTMLPTQVLELGDSLSSRQSESNFSRGRFQLLLQQDGNLVLNTVALPTNFSYRTYYSSGTTGSTNISQRGYRLVFDESGYLYVLRRNNERFEIKPRTIDPSSYVYYRATLGSDGVFSLYSRPKVSNSNQNWTIVWSIPNDICTDLLGDYGSGACGYNSYCVLTNGRPSCECPTGYSFMNQNDRLSGCKPDFTLIGCQKDYKPDDLYEMLTLRNTDWPTADYEQMRPYVEEDCKDACLQDCLCAVAIFRNDTCWKKKLPLSNGRFNMEINSTAFIKVGKNSLISQSPPALGTPSPSTKDRKSTVIVLGSLLGSSVFMNFMLLTSIALVLLFMYQKKLGQPVVLDGNQQQQSALGTSLRSFTYKELEEATDGFREEIGRGAFGIVYKGSLAMMGDPTRNLVAVKKLDTVRIQDGEKEFKTEVSIIGKTHHKNLVQLLGFCQEGPHRLLVYEFMCNGSLASLLFGDLVIKPNWYQRNQIVLGIARGLTYLHEECKSQIIHCDIKPQNILLDNYFTARISDFGLAKLLTDQTRTLTGIRGTRGYVATEWFKNTPVTVKVDVYSFGVVLLEIVSCRKSVELELGGEERSILTDWAYDCYREGRLHELVEKDEDAVNDIRKVEMLVMIAIWCIQEEPSLRPSMKKVTHMLEGVIGVPIPPCPFPQEFSII